MKLKYKRIIREFSLFLYTFALVNYWFEKGIYAIYEPHTNMLLYIGKTNDCFINRWDAHQKDLEFGRHCNKMLQWKYLNSPPFEIEPGIYEDYNFKFQAIHVCSKDTTDEEILELESYYIEHMKPIYNVVRPKNYHEEEWIDEES